MAAYTLEPQVGKIHGRFSRHLTPILTINPGDTVCYRTLDAGWNVSRPTAQDRSKWRLFSDYEPERDSGHPLNGPIAIRGAKPGMTLVVQIDIVEPGAWGWNIGIDWQAARDEASGKHPGEYFFWDIDQAGGTVRNNLNQILPLKPFMGVLGMPPAEEGWHSTIPPRPCGGNIDCKELTAGSALYLPISVDEALFSTGDGHALQADGEISGTAIECPMDRVELTFDLRDDIHLKTPRAHTPAGWLTLGFDPDLNRAYDSAMWAMIDLMTEQFDITRLNALSLASLVVEMRVTQRVNGTNGVHALLPHEAITTLQLKH